MARDLKTVFDAVLDGVIVVDGDAAVERLNAEACRILESSTAKLAGSAVEQVLGREHPLATLTRKVLASRRPSIEDDVPVGRRFENDLRVDIAVAPILSDAGEIEGAVVALRDRTVRDSLRELVSQRDQLTTYGHIAAGIAHEVKNPLGGIRGAAELFKGWADDDRQRRAADLIVREVDRITALVEELMVFARGDALALGKVNVHRVLDGVLELLALDPLARGVGFERVYDPSLPELWGDADRLTQVFLNLARNALQAMAECGGTLQVSTRMSLDNRLSSGTGRTLQTLEVTVADTGPGIPESIADQLATPFFTTRVDGTGLGLAVARHWVSRHDGTLRIESAQGRGTAVRVALPLDPSAGAE